MLAQQIGRRPWRGEPVGVDIRATADFIRPIRAAIVTDIRLYREGLSDLLSRAGVAVVATADGDSAVRAMLLARPDVALLDMSMATWRDDLRALMDSGCEARVVALGLLEAEPQVLACAE